MGGSGREGIREGEGSHGLEGAALLFRRLHRYRNLYDALDQVHTSTAVKMPTSLRALTTKIKIAISISPSSSSSSSPNSSPTSPSSATSPSSSGFEVLSGRRAGAAAAVKRPETQDRIDSYMTHETNSSQESVEWAQKSKKRVSRFREELGVGNDE